MENTSCSLNAPERKVYNVGDVIKVVNYGYSIGGEYTDGQFLQTGQEVFEVEIKSIKKAQLVLE